MKERPILFSGSMVRALLAGTKTQTRRVVKPQFAADAIPVEMPATDPAGGWVVPGHSGVWWCDAAANPDDVRRCPYGQPGDRLWVRETFAPRTLGAWSVLDQHMKPLYRADADRPEWKRIWRPSIHMPRWASRITLEITGVRVGRLQDISEADARSEGCTQNHNGYFWGGPHQTGGMKQMATALQAYQDLWESINGPGSWDANPWVWVLEFRRLNAEQSSC